MERHPLPQAAPQAARRIFMDASFRGVRSHWDSFAAATSTRQMSDSLAGAYLADAKEPLMPLDSAVDGVYFEVLQGKKPNEFRCLEWTPSTSFASAEGFASIGCLSRLCAPYWGEMPDMTGEGSRPNQVSDWTSLQHWAVWRDCLIGLGALRCHASGGDANSKDTARIRWRLSPQGRKLEVVEQSETSLKFRYGGLSAEVRCLEQKGGFKFAAEEITEAPRAAWTPLLAHAAPWSSGDYLHVATIVRPAQSDAVVEIKTLKNGAALVALEPDGRKAFVWVVNLHRQLQQYLLDLPQGVKVSTYKRDLEMPLVPPGEPANAGLVGAESALWVLRSELKLDAGQLLTGLRAGKSR